MHVRMGGAGAALPRLSIPPNGPLATANSRHPITEAGFDTILAKMEDAFERQKKGDNSLGRLRLAGIETPEGVNKPCQKVVRVTPTNETWTVDLDPDTHLPAFVQAVDGNGELLERYVFQVPAPNVSDLVQADAFDPDARWGPAKGLFQRLARAGEAAKKDAVKR
jgi:hypothetical protein